MSKVTSLAMLGLAFASATTVLADGIPTGQTTTITVNRTTGTKYRADGTDGTNQGSVARWVSTQVPGFSLTHTTANGGLINQMSITDQYANLAWNYAADADYNFVLSGDDAVRYRIKSYTITSTTGQCNTVNAPTNVTHTFSATNSTVTVDYTGTDVSKASFRNGTARSDQYTNGVITVTLEELKTKSVVYVVKSNGQEVFRTESKLVRQGNVTADDLPAELRRPFTTLAPVTTTIDDNTTEVEVTATFAAPFDGTSDKYLIKSVGRPNNNTSDRQYLVATLVNGEKYESQNLSNVTDADAYLWTVEGNPYTGVNIKSVKENGYLNKVGSYAIVQAGASADDTKWQVSTPNSGAADQVSFNKAGENSYINVHGGNYSFAFWTDKGANSAFQFIKAVKATYVVTAEGETVYTYTTPVVANSTVEVPSHLTRPLTTLALANGNPTTFTADATVNINATFQAPFDKASQGADPTKFVIHAKNGYYINHQEGGVYTLAQDQNFPESYQWTFEGNPFTGVSVKSVATGTYLKKNAGNTFVVAQATTAADAKWEVNFNNVTPSNFNMADAVGGFTLKDVAYGQALNVHGITKQLSFWQYVDGNSVFYAVEAPSDFKDQIRTDYEAFANEGGGQLFGLTTDAYNQFKALYDASQASTTKVPYTDYAAIKALIDNATSYQLPETGYYRIKNANVDASYMHLTGTALDGNMLGTAAQSDPSTIIYVEKQSDATYRFKAGGHTIAVAENGANKGAFADDNTLQTIRLTRAALGKGYIQFGTADQAYLFYYTNYNKPWTYFKNHDSKGGWVFEPATTLTLPLTAFDGKTYATTCLPYATTLTTAGVKAYTVTTDGVMHELTTTTIEAGTPVLLCSETGVTEATLTLGTDAPIAESAIATTMEFKGNFLSQTVTAESVLTLSRAGEGSTGVGFYKSAATTLPAFQGYFDATTVTAFALIDDVATRINSATTADANTPIYDLTGRKVSKAAKGVYIIGGQKVVR